MRRWEFDSIAQAAGSISSWFPGTPGERNLLQEHLDATIGISRIYLLPSFFTNLLFVIRLLLAFIYLRSSISM